MVVQGIGFWLSLRLDLGPVKIDILRSGRSSDDGRDRRRSFALQGTCGC